MADLPSREPHGGAGDRGLADIEGRAAAADAAAYGDQAGFRPAQKLGFHAGAPLANPPADAHFALIANPAEMAALDGFSQGTQDYPDRSTTLILQVSDLTSGTPLLLEGPGIEKTATIAPAQMPRHFVEQWKQNSQRFPRGVDIILAAPDGIACLPRTTRIKTMEA